jgi:hypothetical protein
MVITFQHRTGGLARNPDFYHPNPIIGVGNITRYQQANEPHHTVAIICLEGSKSDGMVSIRADEFGGEPLLIPDTP